ncbi:MAG: hypothetical protein H0V81_00880 [Solirubrobacterales bacterium]|nr:hypothetical protein [Solirubrobacterales bacterium]
MVSFGRRKAAQEPKHPADPLVTRAADPTEPVAAVGLSVEELWDRALSQLEDGEPVGRIPLDE